MGEEGKNVGAAFFHRFHVCAARKDAALVLKSSVVPKGACTGLHRRVVAVDTWFPTARRHRIIRIRIRLRNDSLPSSAVPGSKRMPLWRDLLKILEALKGACGGCATQSPSAPGSPSVPGSQTAAALAMGSFAPQMLRNAIVRFILVLVRFVLVSSLALQLVAIVCVRSIANACICMHIVGREMSTFPIYGHF